MIAIEPLSEIGHVVTCPHCRAELFKVFDSRYEATFAGYLFEDADTIPIYGALSEKRREGFGWTARLAAGQCPFCTGRLLSISAAFMDVEPDTDTEDVFFHLNGDRGEERNFLARRGVDCWVLTRFDTPQGPMIEHDSGLSRIPTAIGSAPTASRHA